MVVVPQTHRVNGSTPSPLNGERVGVRGENGGNLDNPAEQASAQNYGQQETYLEGGWDNL